jgi:hypothetical protein
MKYLIALLFLINCLAFFMFSHMQKQSEIKSEQAQLQQGAPVTSPRPVKLLSELSAAQLEALNPEPEEPAPSKDQQPAEIDDTAVSIEP